MTSVSTVPDTVPWDNPPHLTPRGTVVLLPGRGEDPRLYERFGSRIGADAYRVRVVADPSRWPEEAAAQVALLAADPELPRPFVLAGSDGGALFAAGLAAAGEVAPDALLLAGLPVRDHRPAAPSWDDELGARTSCPTHRGRLGIAGRVEHGALYEPLPDTWYERADLSAVQVPVLALHGAADPVSPLEQARQAYAAAPAVELWSLADGRHDALNDISHRTSAATVLLFLERLRGGPDAPAVAVRERVRP
ncbi:lysophospholipase [Actinacidiphila acididurans]|uniref:lysophospholipase n=1 Tax=Actinacidiphila acididurans TaxID=2784346 RepID=UPI001F40FF96|nr:lysophospholipase [Actinacidiphila acididurans]